MSNIGGMVATLSLDYSPLLRNLAGARGEMDGFQTYTVNLRNQTSKQAGAAIAASVAAGTSASRSTGSSFAGLLRGTGSIVGGIARIGIGAASAYGNWQLHSIRMKNELMQNQLLLRMMGNTPGPGARSVQWLNQMRGGATQTRSGLLGLVRNTLLVGGALTGLAAAAVYGYGAWRQQSARIRGELLQQKVMTEQLKALRSSGGGGGGSAFSGGLMGGLVGSIAGGAIFQATSFIANIPAASLGLASAAEQAQISFEVMLGSATKAQGMLASLKAYADKSPFNVAGVNEAAKKLLNYGIQAQDILPTIKMLGDVAAGDMEKFDRLSTAFGQMASTGRLMGQDLLQFINAGFNPLQLIAAKTGESMAALKKRMEEGGISSLEVRDAFVAATSEGGRFYQMTERQSDTIAGKFSTMKDAIATNLTLIGQQLTTSLNLKGWIDYLTAGLNQVPFLFANAGTLLQAELLNWNIYLMELVPEFSTTINDIGLLFTAGWEALGGSFHLFFASVKAGITELVNLARAAKAGIDASVKGATGGGVTGFLETVADYSTLGYYGSVTGRQTGITAGKDAFNSTLAAQPDAMKPGTDFASQFGKIFTESLARQTAGPNGGISTADDLKKKREELLKNLIKPEDLKAPEFKADGQLGASFNKSTAEDGKSDGKTNPQSTAALIGSAEAAKIFTAGIGDNPALKIAEESLAIEEQQLEEMKALAANANNFNGILNPQQSAAWTLAEHEPMQIETKPRAERAALSRGQQLNWWTAEADPLPKEPTVNAPRVGMSRGQELNWNKAEGNPQPTKTEQDQLRALEAIARSTEETARNSPKVASI